MTHVFISYSTQNRDYAHKLARRLREERLDVWIDNAEIRSGEEWWQSIVEALNAASAVVVIMTPDSLASQWVKREVMLAEQMHKRVFPVLLEGENWDLFVHIQYADVRKTGRLPPKSFFDELYAFLQVQINITVKTPTIPNTSPPTTPSDQITSLRGCLRNPVVVAALIGLAGAIIAAFILVIGPMVFPPLPTIPVVSAPTSTLTAATESPTSSPVNVTTAAPIVVQPSETMDAAALVTISPSAPTQFVSTTAAQPTSITAPQSTAMPTYVPPTPRPTATAAPQAATSAPTLVTSSYPCPATISSSYGTGIQDLRPPNNASASAGGRLIIRAGTEVRVLAPATTGVTALFRISDANGRELGWISTIYVVLSPTCPA